LINEAWVNIDFCEVDIASHCRELRTLSSAGLNLWRQCKRLSLKQLLSAADTHAFFTWRLLLQVAVRYVNGGEVADNSNLRYSNLDMLHICWRQWRYCFLGEASKSGESDSLLGILLATHFIEWNVVSSEIRKRLFNTLGLEHLSEEIVLRHLQQINYLCGIENGSNSDFQTFNCIFLLFLRELCVEPLRLCSFMLEIGKLINENKAKVFPRLLLAMSWLLDGCRLFVDTKYLQPLQQAVNWEPDNPSICDHSSIYEQLAVFIQTALHSSTEENNTQLISEFVAGMAQQLICSHLQSSLQYHQQGNAKLVHHKIFREDLRHNVICLARCPVRIDLAGGWSDTPPICYDQSGSVSI
jgi:hypothetical protein